MAEEAPASVARGFLFADLRGYSAWVEQHGDHAAAGLLREYRDVVRQAAGEFEGAEIKTEGDSFYLAFGSPSAAIRCGLRILELAAGDHGAAKGPIPVGIGIHAGETVATGEGYVGSVVNVAARVCAQAAAGELLVTDAVRSMTQTYLDVTFSPRGRKRLKGIAEAIALYRVTGSPPVPVSRWARRPRMRWPVVAAAIAIPVVLLAVALIGGALVREGAAAPTPSPAPTGGATVGASPSSPTSAAGQAAYPDAAETRLLGLVDERDHEQCQRALPEDGPVLEFGNPSESIPMERAPVQAGIECDLGGITAPDRVWFWQLGLPCIYDCYPPGAVLAVHAGRVGATPGVCRDERPAIETWSFGGMSGKLVCFETSTGDAVLLWIYDDDERWLFARAVRDDRDTAALLEWWEDVGRFAGP